jgi:hypothetical protein
MTLITDTYADDQQIADLLEDFIETDLSGYTTKRDNLAGQARIWTNNALGLDNDFTAVELGNIEHEGIISANDHWVASRMIRQLTGSEDLVNYAKDLMKMAKEYLILWGRAHGIRVAFDPLEILEDQERAVTPFSHRVTNKNLSRDYTEESVDGG